MSSQVSSAGTAVRRSARNAATVDRLLAAADEELTAIGPDALTMRGVATRAGVSAATAYNHFSSREHLFAELFWRHLVARPVEHPDDQGADATARLQTVVRQMAEQLHESPPLAEAATKALLGHDPDVERLRMRIGAEFARRFIEAITPAADADGPHDSAAPAPALLDALVFAFTGAMLQAGMGVMTYAELGDRLAPVVAVIMGGHE